MELRKVSINKVVINKSFWTIIAACIAFTVFAFGIATDGINTNAQAIQISSEAATKAMQIISEENTKERQIIQADIKQILEEVGYIRGFMERNGSE